MSREPKKRLTMPQLEMLLSIIRDGKSQAFDTTATGKVLIRNGWAIKLWPHGLRITTEGQRIVSQNRNTTWPKKPKDTLHVENHLESKQS